MPANRRAALQHFTLERGVIISVSMLDHLGKRVEFLRACAYLNNIRTDGMFLISFGGVPGGCKQSQGPPLRSLCSASVGMTGLGSSNL